MEPTLNATAGKKSSSWVMWVIIILVIILIAVFALRKDDEMINDTDTVSTESSMEKNELEASAADAVNFNNEASLKEIDKEFQ